MHLTGSSTFLTVAILTPFVAMFLLSRWRYTTAPVKFLVALGKQSRWRTHPRLMQTEEELALAREVAASLESAGHGHVRVALFMGKATMDLIVNPSSPEVSASVLQSAVGSRGRVRAFRPGFRPLRYL